MLQTHISNSFCCSTLIVYVSVYGHFVRESRQFLKHICWWTVLIGSRNRVNHLIPIVLLFFHYQIDRTENYFQIHFTFFCRRKLRGHRFNLIRLVEKSAFNKTHSSDVRTLLLLNSSSSVGLWSFFSCSLHILVNLIIIQITYMENYFRFHILKCTFLQWTSIVVHCKP